MAPGTIQPRLHAAVWAGGQVLARTSVPKDFNFLLYLFYLYSIMPTSRKMKAAATASVERELQLYVAGSTPKSTIAFRNLERLCKAYPVDRYRIEIVEPRRQTNRL
jgi:hypothetical protein